MEHFSDIVKHKLQYYVYALIDPRNNEVFYVGKGINDRVFQHEIDSETEIETNKLNRIRAIKQSGNEVKKVIVLYGLSEDAAFAAEAALINMFNYFNTNILTNAVSGHHSDWAMSVEDIEKIYGAETLSTNEIYHNLLVIKINSLYNYRMTDKEVMECTRGHWVININNAKKADYLVAVYHGLIVGIFENMEWYPSGEKTSFYPRPSEENLSLTNRKYCTCSPVAPQKNAYKKYMGKSISDLVKNAQNPVSYIWGRKNATAKLQSYRHGFQNGFEHPIVFDEKLGSDLAIMGYDMDAWKSYKMLGKPEEILSSSNYAFIKETISDIDYKTASALLFSQWRYLTHWAYMGSVPLEEKHSPFFLAVIDRIAELSK